MSELVYTYATEADPAFMCSSYPCKDARVAKSAPSSALTPSLGNRHPSTVPQPQGKPKRQPNAIESSEAQLTVLGIPSKPFLRDPHPVVPSIDPLFDSFLVRMCETRH